MVLSVKNLFKQYKDEILLKNVDFEIKKGQKVGIVGVNGSGKSTLLKILIGEDYPDNKPQDKVEVKINPGIRVGYISQDPKYNQDWTIFDVVASNVKCEDYEIKAVLNKFGLTDLKSLVKTLSGGEKRKVSLAIALLKQTDLLILDEPTNHLDQGAVDYLEDYLIKYKGAILLVSHDRYFLNKTTNDIFELEKGNLYIYKNVDFDEFLDLKSQRIYDAKSEHKKNKAIFKKESAWISRGVKARRTKSKDRIERFEKLKNKMQVDVKSKLDLTSLKSRIGTKTIELTNISKKYEDKVLFENFTYNFGRYQRVGIVGPNGSGKTTLLNIIAKQIESDTGEVVYGETIKVAYFSQMLENMNEELKVVDFIKSKAEYIDTIYGNVSAQKVLESFLFSRSVQHFKISTLSGGQKRRLYLLSILIDAPNVLILDEPTNDFDIDTLLVLEEFIENFQGIVITVSHDRYFLDKIVDDLFIFEDKNIIPFNGNYSDYIQNYKKNKKTSKRTENVKSKPKNKKLKFTFNEKKEFETIDQDIEKLEEDIVKVDRKIIKYSKDFDKLLEYTKKREELEEQLSIKQERWYYLNELLEKINS